MSSVGNLCKHLLSVQNFFAQNIFHTLRKKSPSCFFPMTECRMIPNKSENVTILMQCINVIFLIWLMCHSNIWLWIVSRKSWQWGYSSLCAASSLKCTFWTGYVFSDQIISFCFIKFPCKSLPSMKASTMYYPPFFSNPTQRAHSFILNKFA